LREELAAAELAKGPDRWRNLADILIRAAALHPQAIQGGRASDWGAVFCAVLRKCAPHDQQNIVQSLLLLPDLPIGVLPDLQAVAGPKVLEILPFSADQVTRIARRADASELAHLARRSGLSTATTGILLARGGADVHAALAENASARISPSCFAALAELAYANRGLRAALIARPDLPKQHLEKLWPYLSSEDKRRALAAAPLKLAERLQALMADKPPQSGQDAPKKASPRAAA
jgi:hypothetical protein